MAAPSAALPGADGIAMRRKRGGGGGKAGGGKVGFVGGDGIDQIPPGKVPGVPEIAHVGGGYIQLLWAPPISVGSHSLSGYEICAREGGDGDFEVCHVSDDVKCATNVPVDRNKWLEFTVAAMSDAGVGPASRPSMPVLTRQRVKRGGDHDKARRSSGGKSRSKSRGDAAPRRHNRREPASTRAAPEDSEGSELSDNGDADDEDAGAPSTSTSLIPAGLPHSGSPNKHHAAPPQQREPTLAELIGAPNALRYEALKNELADLEEGHAMSLGRDPTDEELCANPAYRDLALEYAELRKVKEAAEKKKDGRTLANREWVEMLNDLGFDIKARMVELELGKSRWHMDFLKRNRRAATIQDELASRAFVSLHEAIVKEQALFDKATRALGRVSSFDASQALAIVLEASEDVPEMAKRIRILLDAYCAYDSSGTGALNWSDFGRLLRGELGSSVLGGMEEMRRMQKDGQLAMPKADVTINDVRSQRIHARADTDGDGWVDFNEFIKYAAPRAGKSERRSVGMLEEEHTQQLNQYTMLLGEAAVHLAGSATFNKKAQRRRRLKMRAAQQSSDDSGGDTPWSGDEESFKTVDDSFRTEPSFMSSHHPGGEFGEEERRSASEVLRRAVDGREVHFEPPPMRSLSLNPDASGGSASEDDDFDSTEDEEEEGARTLRTLAREAAERKRAEALVAASEKQRREESRSFKEKELRDEQALGRQYVEKINLRIAETTAAGYDDHTAQLTPRAHKQLCRQLQRYDRSGEGRLDLEDFCTLCAKVAEMAVAGGSSWEEATQARSPSKQAEQPELISRLQMMALFSQADVTGAHNLCASQWAWARTQLAGLIEHQVKVRKAREEQAAARAKVDEQQAKAQRLALSGPNSLSMSTLTIAAPNELLALEYLQK